MSSSIEALTRQQESLERWLIALTIALTVGIIVEEWKEFKEIGEFLCAIFEYFKSGQFDRPALRWATMGAAAVVFCIAGEGLVEILASNVNTDLRAANQEKENSLERGTAQLREQTTASLNAAEQKLNQAEFRLSPWDLDDAAQTRIVEKLKPFTGTPFELAVDAHPYATDLGITLDELLGRRAQWISMSANSTATRLTPRGTGMAVVSATDVTIEVPPKGIAQYPPPAREIDLDPPARALTAELNAEGIPSRMVPRKPGTYWLGIRIIVGRKP
jgi:hypothetical protein